MDGGRNRIFKRFLKKERKSSRLHPLSTNSWLDRKFVTKIDNFPRDRPRSTASKQVRGFLRTELRRSEGITISNWIDLKFGRARVTRLRVESSDIEFRGIGKAGTKSFVKSILFAWYIYIKILRLGGISRSSGCRWYGVVRSKWSLSTRALPRLVCVEPSLSLLSRPVTLNLKLFSSDDFPEVLSKVLGLEGCFKGWSLIGQIGREIRKRNSGLTALEDSWRVKGECSEVRVEQEC